MNKNMQIISKNELVDFPNQDVFNVPAKIDTGADNCAIWASNIQEKRGVLQFSLFGAGSAFYTGKIIKTDDYKTMPIKNSFGEKETRYVVKLSINFGEKRYKMRFTLADRSRNHFPVLIGKNFLRKRFLVDVASSYLLAPPEQRAGNNVIVLSSRIDEPVRDFFDQVQKEMGTKQQVELTHYDDLAFWFGAQPKVMVLSTSKDLGDAKMIYIKNYKKYPEHAAAVAQYAIYRNVIFRDEELGQTVSMSKLSEMMRLSCFGLPIPKGVAMHKKQLKKHADTIIEEIGLPLVLKDVFSDKGKNNHFVESKADFLEILSNTPKDCFFVAQEYIPNNGFLRAIVLGKEVAMTVKRTTAVHKDPRRKHLNKPTGGANASLLKASEIPSPVASLAVKASEVMQRQVAGIDLIKDNRTNEWYILEVNYNPEMVSAAFTDEKIKAFAHYLGYELERW